MPGLVNTHTHVPDGLFPRVRRRSAPDGMAQQPYLSRRGEVRHAEMVYAGALLAMAEMLLSGTTTFCDGYFYRERRRPGRRGRPACGPSSGRDSSISPPRMSPTRAGRWRIAGTFRRHAGGTVHPCVTPALFCHTPYTCSPATLRKHQERGPARRRPLPHPPGGDAGRGEHDQGAIRPLSRRLSGSLGVLDATPSPFTATGWMKRSWTLLAAQGV